MILYPELRNVISFCLTIRKIGIIWLHMVLKDSGESGSGSRPLDTIRKNVKESMQTQVENFILRKIESNEWAVGEKIPSERYLSEKP